MHLPSAGVDTSSAHPPATSVREGLFDRAFLYPLFWLLLVGSSVFALYVAIDLGWLQTALAIDRSYMVSVILLLTLFAALHGGHQLFKTLADTDEVDALLSALQQKPVTAGRADLPLSSLPAVGTSRVHTLSRAILQSRQPRRTATPVANTAPAITGGNSSADEPRMLLEIEADRLRAPVEFGNHLADLLVRLGLLGTIIGFILIFTSLSTANIDAADELQDLLVAMSGGMGTALTTTLFGLVCSIVVNLQNQLLGRQAEHLLARLMLLESRL